MDQFVDGLRAEGAHDSEGTFTVAVDKASWKLAAFRLAEPQSYPLHVVASAVAAKASRLAITRQGQSVRFSFDGQPYSQADLDLLRLPALGEGTARRVRELAIAISAGSATGHLIFNSIGPGGGCQLQVLGEEVTMTALDGQPGQTLLVGSELSELGVEILKARCRFAPLDLTIDGVSIRNPIDFGIFEPSYYGFYLLPGTTDLVVRPPSLSQRKFFHWTGPIQSGAPTVHLAFTSVQRASLAGLTLISDGVGHQLDNEVLGFPYLCGVVCANHLKKDISQTGYVENRDHEKLMELLRRCAVDFLERFCAAPSLSLPATICLDLRHRLTRLPWAATSQAIQDFLKRITESTPITDRQTLQARGEAAAAGDPTEYQAARATIRQELSRVRQGGKGRYRASDLLASEDLLHRAAGVRDQEHLELAAVWRVLYPRPVKVRKQDNPEYWEVRVSRSDSTEAPLSDEETWAVEALASQATEPVSRYRAQLVLLPRSSPDQVRAWLEEEVMAPEWSALIRYAFLSHQDLSEGLARHNLGRLASPLQAVALAHQGKMSDSLEAFSQLADRLGPRWLEVGGAVTAGKTGFRDWVVVRSRLSIASLSDKNWPSWAAYRDWRGLLSAAPVKEISRASLIHGSFDTHFLPLLLYRLYLTENMHEAFTLLSPVLLQQSLGPAGRPLLDLHLVPQEGGIWDFLAN
jgi:hypothetical protein